MAIDSRLEQRFSAVPVHSPWQYSRLGLDPKLARKFLRTSGISPEEKTMLTQYIVQSKWTPRSRCIYGAVTDGFSTLGEIETVTGLSRAEVEKGVVELEKKGMLRRVSS